MAVNVKTASSPSFLLLGEPTAGKTHFLMTAPRPMLVVDCHGNTDQWLDKDGIDVLNISAFEDLSVVERILLNSQRKSDAAVAEQLKYFGKYKTFGLDTINEIQLLLYSNIARADGSNLETTAGQIMSKGDWTDYNQILYTTFNFVARLKNAAVGSGMKTICTIHTREENGKVVPNLIGNARHSLLGRFPVAFRIVRKADIPEAYLLKYKLPEAQYNYCVVDDSRFGNRFQLPSTGKSMPRLIPDITWDKLGEYLVLE